MFELPFGVICILAWGVLQFKVQPASGLYHILLAAGVILLVRGIAVSRWGTPKES
jgi:hypothetical protein